MCVYMHKYMLSPDFTEICVYTYLEFLAAGGQGPSKRRQPSYPVIQERGS